MSLKITCLLQIYKHKLSAMVLDITWRSTASRTIIPARANCDFIMDGSNSQVWLNTCTHAHMHMRAHTHPSNRDWENIVTRLFATMQKRV